MARKIKNPIEVRAVVLYDNDGLHIQSALIRYTLSCEHNVNERKEMEVLQNPEIQNCVKDFVEEGLKQADIHEGIAGADSLLEYPVA
ncbi:hypothetical protein LCGC14_0416660 [marine sediment metagenome]|uniref:Uncharacterized protein n=1 Tax=marine sediment metagenome TaxID=412755 RepID=A0A0F9TA59_9ZZZZ